MLPQDFFMYFFDLWRYILISLKTVLIFPKNFLDLRFDTVEKQDIINFSSKSYASIVLFNSEVTFLEEEEDSAVAHFFCAFCL